MLDLLLFRGLTDAYFSGRRPLAYDNRTMRAEAVAAVTNSTMHSPLTESPNILDIFIPGYGLVSSFLMESFGFDVTLLVTIYVLIWALETATAYIYQHATGLFRAYFMSFVSVDSNDELYDEIMEWLARQPVSRACRGVMAKSSATDWDSEPQAPSRDDTFFSDCQGAVESSDIRFEPYYGSHRFWHQGRYFEFTREIKQESSQKRSWLENRSARDQESIFIYCIGRSTEPARALIRYCQNEYNTINAARTTLRRPAPKSMKDMGNPWQRVANRPSRHIDTVVLDSTIKKAVIADIEEYLKPASAKWYANRGIPYRRGYLFHGPPGTGKTSLCFALAGIFDLDIFCISLLDPEISETDLSLLFNTLPRHCIVLLEDIDSAGLVLQRSSHEQGSSGGFESDQGADNKDFGRKSTSKGISLSGLLNAIDGVASQEGRVLIMTTNHPEKLDGALIRPGRVDLQVAFTLTSKAQVEQLFVRMYSPDMEQSGRQHLDEKSVAGPFDESSLESIARQFAAKIPDMMLSPAEIQGFLLTRKKDPDRALDEVGEWISRQTVLREAKGPVHA